MRRTFFFLVAIGLLLLGVGLGVGGTLLFGPNTGPYDGSQRLILPKNPSLETAIDSLEAKNVLASPSTFRLVAELTGWGHQLKTGHYRVSSHTSNYALLDTLRRGLQTPVRIVVPPGSRPGTVSAVMGRRLETDSSTVHATLQDTSLAQSLDTTPSHLFGYMLPDTYHFYWNLPPEKVVRRIKQSFDQFYERHLSPGADSLGLSKSDVVTLASIVEWEALQDDEKATIAGVYLNRLAEGWRLQADPTVQYALLDTRGERTRRVLYRDLEIQHPYNTYVHGGLPPGPITNPSPTSLRGVVNPEQHEYFYFAADGSGGHTFSRTLRDHNRAAQEYHRMLDER